MNQSERVISNSLSFSFELLGKGEGHKWIGASKDGGSHQCSAWGDTPAVSLRHPESPVRAEALWSVMGCFGFPQNSHVEAFIANLRM